MAKAQVKPDTKPDDKKDSQEDPLLPTSMESLRGRTPDELAKMVEVLDAHLRSIHQSDEGELRSLDEDEQRAFDLGMSIRSKAMDMLEEHKRVAEVFARRPKSVLNAFNILKSGGADDIDAHDVRRLTSSEVRTAALRRLDDREAAGHLRSDQKEQVDLQIRRNPEIGRRILLTENDSYRNAWMKAVTRPQPIFTSEESAALLAFDEHERAAAESPTSAGGFGIPVKLAA